MEGWSKKEKGLMDMDTWCGDCSGEESKRGLNGNGKNTIKIIEMKKRKCESVIRDHKE